MADIVYAFESPRFKLLEHDVRLYERSKVNSWEARRVSKVSLDREVFRSEGREGALNGWLGPNIIAFAEESRLIGEGQV